MPSAPILKKSASLRTFRRRLLKWYRANRRPLPWRRTSDPYHIWISEIMLQQTRVAAMLDHYESFLKKFPTILHLASAEESEVLAAWSGLGYYRRARMLHRAAKMVAEKPAALLPRSSTELRALPGIGRYTANAIASIAFHEPVAVVDGNVERVLGRVLGKQLAGEEFWTTAQAFLDADCPGDFNQAMMELGATVCGPATPSCGTCPIQRYCASRCATRKAGRPEIRLKKTVSVLLARRSGALLLRQRPIRERLMPGMWELPESNREIRGNPLLKLKHAITTTDWSVSVFLAPRTVANETLLWIPLSEAAQLPLTGLARKILRRLKLLA